VSLARFRLGQDRHKSRAEAEEEDGRGDQDERDAPLEDRRRIARGATQGARPLNVIANRTTLMRLHDAEDREQGAREGYLATVSRRRAGQKDERKDAPDEDLGGEGETEPSREGCRELASKRHVSQAEDEVDQERPERDLPHRGERLHVQGAVPSLRDPHVDQDDEGGSGHDRGQEEGDGHHRTNTSSGRACSASADRAI
jgi:hypothetical protein